jgi:hypothetical protein
LSSDESVTAGAKARRKVKKTTLISDVSEKSPNITMGHMDSKKAETRRKSLSDSSSDESVTAGAKARRMVKKTTPISDVSEKAPNITPGHTNSKKAEMRRKLLSDSWGLHPGIDLILKMQDAIDHWEGGLRVSGGALLPSKSQW